MTDVYDQHRASFSNVSAYAVVRNGERVANISFKFPRDGAGRLYAYVHWLGSEMVRGFAGGYGYDKRSAACANAARKITGNELKRANRTDYHDQPHFAAFLTAMEKDGGEHWDNALRNAGFDVWQVI